MIEPISIEAVHIFRVKIGSITGEKEEGAGGGESGGGSQDKIIVNIASDTGYSGWGCASPCTDVTGEDVEKTVDTIKKGIEKHLMERGMRPIRALLEEISEKWPDAPAARAAVDIGLHDIWAKQLAASLLSVFGPFRFNMPTSGTVIPSDPETTAAHANEVYNKGFSVIKMVGGNAAEDIERIRVLKRDFGRSVAIRLDARGGYSLEEAREVVKETGKNLQLFEQPVPRDDIDGLLALTDECPVPVVADESAVNESETAELIRKGIKSVKIKLMKCGGLTPARRICQLARISGVAVVLGTADETPISATAAAHLALSHPAIRYADMDSHLRLDQKMVSNGLSIERGTIEVPTQPGLGIQVRKSYLRE